MTGFPAFKQLLGSAALPSELRPALRSFPRKRDSSLLGPRLRGDERRKTSTISWGHTLAAAITLALAFTAPRALQAQAPEKLSIVVFSPPSLGAFMPPVIKARKLDAANGLDITFHERTPDAYTAQFNSGEFKLGGSASLLTIGLADSRGVKVKYLFNLFDFWGAVVTSRPEVKTLKDLEGKQLAGARATTNYVMFEFLAKKLGVDVAKIQVVNTATPGLVGYALADRADAIQIWEPAYTLLVAKKPDIRTLDIAISKTWSTFAGGSRIPYLGVAAHADWADQNPALVAKLYATYKAAAEWIMQNPDEAAPLVAPKSTPEDLKAMASLIRSNERLAISLVPANDIRKEIEAVYRAGIDVGYFPALPSNETIYGKPIP
jgi:ABC-type nitrate/sulfonate/bicarbonate transport system substrate-binding protein